MRAGRWGAVMGLAFLMAPGSGAAQDVVFGGGTSALELRARVELERGFSSVAGLRELPDGSVLVSDGLEAVLVRLGTTGDGRVLGRRGQGPREYSRPDMLLALPGDSTVLFDAEASRYLLLDPDGEPVRTFRLEGSARVVATQRPRATDREGRLYVRERDGGNIMMRPGAEDDEVRLHRVAASRNDATPVAELTSFMASHRPVGVPVRTEHGVTQALMVLPRPYAPDDGWSVLADGTVVILRASDDRIEWYDPDGSRLVGPPLASEERRVTQADRRRFIDAWAATEIAGHGEFDGLDLDLEDELDFPPSMPPFAGGFHPADPQDRVWIRRSHPGDEQETFELRTRGRSHGTVALPAGERWIGFGTEAVYTVRTDDLGLQWIVRYTLP